MGYKILDISEELRLKYTKRDGLEGPFFYGGSLVLYYDPQQGQYLNPTTDLYMSYDDYHEFFWNIWLTKKS
jgi:hypothetical protein